MHSLSDTHALIEKLDEHALNLKMLLQVGANVLGDDDQRGCRTTPGDPWSQTRLELDHCGWRTDGELSDASSTTASSCGSSPRSFKLPGGVEDGQDKAVFERFYLWLAAQELKCLHREIYAARKQISVAHKERLTKVVEDLARNIDIRKRSPRSFKLPSGAEDGQDKVVFDRFHLWRPARELKGMQDGTDKADSISWLAAQELK